MCRHHLIVLSFCPDDLQAEWVEVLQRGRRKIKLHDAKSIVIHQE